MGRLQQSQVILPQGKTGGGKPKAEQDEGDEGGRSREGTFGRCDLRRCGQGDRSLGQWLDDGLWLRLNGAKTKDGSVAAARDLEDQRLMFAIGGKVGIDAFAKFGRTDPDDVVLARIVGVLAPEHHAPDLLLMDVAAALLDRPSPDVEEKLLEPECPFEVGALCDTFDHLPALFGIWGWLWGLAIFDVHGHYPWAQSQLPASVARILPG
jgi:hypothetical protein